MSAVVLCELAIYEPHGPGGAAVCLYALSSSYAYKISTGFASPFSGSNDEGYGFLTKGKGTMTCLATAGGWLY